MDSQEISSKTLTDLIREKSALLKSGDFFALLGIPRDADINAVRNAYFALAKILHPDALARQRIQGLEREAIEVFKALTEAYNTLIDRKKRIEYEAQIQSASIRTTGEMRAVRDKTQEARIFFHKGMLFLQRRAYPDAEACFRRAAELDPSTGRYFSYLGYAIMLNESLPSARRMEEARQWFEKAIEVSNNDHEPYYFMSLYHKAAGDPDKQRQCLQDALSINPRHVESRREMRLLAMRQTRGKGSGFLGGVQTLLSRLRKK